MHAKFYKILIIVLITFFQSSPAQDKPDLDKVLRTKWQAEMLKEVGRYLNQSVWALLQTGMAPDYALAMMRSASVDKFNSENCLQSLLILSLPASLTKGGPLPNDLKAKYRFLNQKWYNRLESVILRSPYLPKISNYGDLVTQSILLQNSLQIFTLTVFESKELSSDEVQKLLVIVDRLIYHYGEWLNSDQDLKDFDDLLEGWAPHFASINSILDTRSKNGNLQGVYALLAAELNFIQYFLEFMEKKK